MANPIKVIKLTGVSGSLEGKADAIHTHVLSDITDAGTAAASSSADFATAAQGLVAASALQAEDIDTLTELNANFTDGTILVDDADPRLIDDRNPLTHTHTLSDITDSGSAAALDVPTSGDATAAQVVKGDDSRLTGAAYAPVSHLHTLSEISDSGSAAALDVPASGNATAGQVVKGTDTRLINARTPVTHSHPESAISDLGTNIILESDIDIDAAGFVLDEDDLVSNSSTQLATQASIKAYVDNSTSTAMDYKGLYDPATNTPNLDASPTAGSISQGDTYTVLSATGQFYGTESLNEGDTLIATQDDPSLAAHWAVILSTQPEEVVGNLRYAADYDASAGAPPLNAPQGTTYRVSVAGLGIGFFSSLLPVDTLIIAKIDSPVVEQDWLSLTPTVTSISDLDDVSSAAVTDKFALMADGAAYVGRAIVEADISDLGTYLSSVDLATDVTGDLPYANIVPATAASKLVGRGSTGAGDMEEITIGSGLTMTGTTISASGGSAPSDAAYGASWNGDTTNAASKNALYDKIETLSSGGQVDSVVAGTNITVDNSNPVNPVISSSGGGGGTTQGSSSTYDISAVARSSTPDARGNYSVDLQMQGNADDVAAGTHSALIGGSFNRAVGSHSFISGGTGNETTAFGSSSVILASQNSKSNYNNSAIIAHTQADPADTTISAYNCAVIGGSGHAIEGMMGGGYSVILGGQTNSCVYQTRSVILGGSDNAFTALGGNACVIGGTRVKVANKDGVFAWADDTAADYTITQDKTANFRVANGMHITAPLFIDERASALADIAGRGQIWVKTATPNELWFTDDAGSDRPISEGVYTVAALPTGVAGRRAFVTDSGNTLASHHGQVVTNGGANFVPVYHDGSSWHVG